jgi:UDP-N-acetylmuramate dehydrogenase
MIEAKAKRALVALLCDRIEFDVPLARHTSLRIGGPADAMATPQSREELSATVALCAEYALPLRVLGAGFNVLVSEGGLPGVVLRLKKLRDIKLVADDTLSVYAGASHATVTRFCVDHGLSGLEFGAGIPGTVGGWLAMNAGIGVREMKDVVLRIEIMDREGRMRPLIERGDLDFHYRELGGLPSGSVLVRAELRVEASEPAKVRSEIDRLLAHRQSTQPTDIPSCGSVFRNPDGDYAGRLIEAAGLKGAREGDAEISTVHANFIVNHGAATARDVLQLIDRAREAVAAQTGTQLETEVQLIGRAEGDAS